jgi:RNA polymerase sigma-70 factor (ECF subfamily)
MILASAELDRRERALIDPSDIVQQTLIDAREKWPEISVDEAQVSGWLRNVLNNNLVDAFRHLRRGKRDVGREISLEAGLEASSQRLADCLAEDQSSPSQRAVRNEDLIRLSDALTALPGRQRDAVVMHHLRGMSLRDTAQALASTDTATAGLIHRGLKTLRELMQDSSSGQ